MRYPFISIHQPINFFWRRHCGKTDRLAEKFWCTQVQMPHILCTFRLLTAKILLRSKFVPRWNYHARDRSTRLETNGNGMCIHDHAWDIKSKKAPAQFCVKRKYTTWNYYWTEKVPQKVKVSEGSGKWSEVHECLTQERKHEEQSLRIACNWAESDGRKWRSLAQLTFILIEPDVSMYMQMTVTTKISWTISYKTTAVVLRAIEEKK